MKPGDKVRIVGGNPNSMMYYRKGVIQAIDPANEQQVKVMFRGGSIYWIKERDLELVKAKKAKRPSRKGMEREMIKMSDEVSRLRRAMDVLCASSWMTVRDLDKRHDNSCRGCDTCKKTIPSIVSALTYQNTMSFNVGAMVALADFQMRYSDRATWPDNEAAVGEPPTEVKWEEKFDGRVRYYAAVGKFGRRLEVHPIDNDTAYWRIINSEGTMASGCSPDTPLAMAMADRVDSTGAVDVDMTGLGGNQ